MCPRGKCARCGGLLLGGTVSVQGVGVPEHSGECALCECAEGAGKRVPWARGEFEQGRGAL